MSDMKQIIDESFIQYAGAVLQSRALVDARDCLKPSARQIFYCLYTDKFLPTKPFKKTLKAIGSVARMYIHGDSSAEGVLMRSGQPFAMRYPLIEVEGNAGNLMLSGNWAAPRYTASRLSNFSVKLFEDVDKDTIQEWRDNYDDTEQYPSVLPSKGFYNIVNGTTGIGIGAASSIPQFNIREVNLALEKLLLNPDIDFEEIYCAPDFATGAILLNENEVKESLKVGTGLACKLRSVVDFDANERCFIVTEIPYSVYTNTICGELEAIIESEDNPGIERFNDLTGSSPLIKIYLDKKGNPSKILKYLYKNTSLQYYYSINITMLDNGRFPRVYGWKDALQAHIDHEKVVYERGFIYDLQKIKKRLHILDGLIKAISIIDEVVSTIKSATDTSNAKIKLMQLFGFSEEQAKAILEIKLARLAHLEIAKLQKEQEELELEKSRIESILNNKDLFNNELIKGWRDTAQRFGDERRTKILSLAEEDGEPVEIKTLQISLTNKNNLIVNEASTLYTQKRGGVGNKLKLENGEFIISTSSIETNEMMLLFTKDGDYYSYKADGLNIGVKIPICSIVPIKDWQKVCALCSANIKNKDKCIVFVTKNGFIKKSEFSEYNTNRQIGIRALALEDDEIVSVLFTDSANYKIGIATECGNFIMIRTDDVRPLGRISRGVHGIKLNDGDYVCAAKSFNNSVKEIVSISSSGLCKRTNINEFNIQGKNTKGSKIQKLIDADKLVDIAPIIDEKEILVGATNSCIKLLISDIPLLSRGTQGTRTIKLSQTEHVVGIEKI